MTSTSPYTNVTNYENNPDFVARTEKICRRVNGQLIEEYRTVYVRKDAVDGSMAIPQRANSFRFDPEELAKAQAWADKMRDDLSQK